MDNIISIQFVKPYLAYNAGQVAGFTAEAAANIIKAGFAKKWQPSAPPKRSGIMSKMVQK